MKEKKKVTNDTPIKFGARAPFIMEDEMMSNNLKRRTITFDNWKLSSKMHGGPNVMAHAELLK
jgi:hypothetical protein